MSWAICTKCFSKPSQSNKAKFLITSCCHVLCDNCANVDDTHCGRCQASCRMVLINNEMPEEVKDVFSDVTERATMLIKAMEFQEYHRNRLMNYYRTIAQKYDAAKLYIKDIEIKFNNLKQKYEAAKFKINEQERIIQDLNRKIYFYKQNCGTSRTPSRRLEPLTQLDFEAPQTPMNPSIKLQHSMRANPVFTPTYSMYRNQNHASITPESSRGSVQSSQIGSMSSYSGRNRSLPGYTPPSKTMELLTLLNKSRSQK